jgi:2'-5' RNA ligase
VARLFFALWPDDAVRGSLAHWAEQAHAAAGGRMTQARNLHMTLAFLGETDARRIPELHQAAQAVRLEPCVLKLDRCAYWKHNRIVWVGGEAPPQLAAAAARLREALAAIGARHDAKPLVPHVSLLRNARAGVELPRFPAIDWALRDFVLLASGRDAQGPVYRRVAGPFGQS